MICLAKALYFIRGFRKARIRTTKRGYHLIFFGVECSENGMYKLRSMIGDDRNRIRLDLCSKKRVKQVLFTRKKIKYFNQRK